MSPAATGDGLSDLLIDVWDLPGVGNANQLVASPLHRRIVLPNDVVAEFPYTSGSGIADVIDLDGDGLVDFLVGTGIPYEALTIRAVFSPVAGTVDATGGPVFDGRAIDLEGDGVAEQLRTLWPDLIQEVRPPGEAGWAGAPILTIAPSGCDWPDQGGIGWTFVHPDLDGDGVRDLWVGGADPYYAPGCGGFVFPADTSGLFDPVTAPTAVGDVPDLVVVGDQTGDGVPDLLGPGGISAGPFTFVDGAAIGGPAFDAPWAWATLSDSDFDGDGIRDWWALESERLVVLTGGPAGGVVTGVPWIELPLVGEVRDAAVFVEDGVGGAVVLYDDRPLEILDLGPATVIERTTHTWGF